MDNQNEITRFSKKGNTKQKIVNAAIKSFGKNGVESTKLIDIAKEAGVNHSLVLYHFESFDSICYQVVESLVNEYFAALQKMEIQSILSPQVHLENFIASHFLLAKKNPGRFCIWIHFYYKSSQDEKYRKLLKLIRIHTLDKIKTILIFLFSEKKLSDKKLDEASTFVLSIISGNIILALTEEDMPLENYGKMTVNMINNYLSHF